MEGQPPAPDSTLPTAPAPREPSRNRRRLHAAIRPSHVKTSLFGKAVEALPLVLVVTLVPRALGPADYGQFASALVVVTVGSSALAVAGTWLAPTYVAAAGADRAAVARALARRLSTWYGLQLIVAWAAAAALLIAFPDRFAVVTTVLVASALSLDLIATLSLQLALGLGRVAAWSFRYAFQNTVLVVAAVLLHEIFGSGGAVAAVTIASASALAYGIAAVVRPLAGAPSGSPAPAGSGRFAVLLGISELLDHAVYRGGVLAVALLAGSAAETGYAALALGFATAGIFTVWQVFAVQLVGLVQAAPDPALAVGGAARRLARAGLLVLVPLAAGTALVREPLLELLAGDEYGPAEPALGIALAVLPLVPAAALAGQTSALNMRPAARLVISVSAAAAFVVATAIAVPRWGATGATGSLLCAVAMMVGVAAVLFRDVLTFPLLAASLGGSALVLTIVAAT